MVVVGAVIIRAGGVIIPAMQNAAIGDAPPTLATFNAAYLHNLAEPIREQDESNSLGLWPAKCALAVRKKEGGEWRPA